MQFLHKMFNVSALLLDDAFKLATPTTNGAINETLTFHKVVVFALFTVAQFSVDQISGFLRTVQLDHKYLWIETK